MTKLGRLDLIVPCVDRKRDGARAPRLGDVLDLDIDRQLARWELELANAGDEVPARDRYMGEAWLCALQLEEDARDLGFSPVLWVVSAGYGLISADDPISAYGATFSPPSVDDAGLDPTGKRTAERRRHWWKALARSRALATGRPRRLAELPAATGGSQTVVVGSSAYVSALHRDLEVLLASPNAMLVCAGFGLDGDRSDPAFDHRIETRLEQGTRLSLNHRVAMVVLTQLSRGRSRSQINASLQETTRRCIPRTVPDRDPMTDDEVMSFIQGRRAQDPTVTKSPLLRQLRDDGQACEQKRFGALFEAVLEQEEARV